jgi:uncharacterized damage-inducible protein DinB
MSRPDRSEAADYYFRYIDQVAGDDINRVLDEQLAETRTLFRSISEDQSQHRYAADKWSVRQVVSHLSDTERLFVFRAFWFARGFESALPSFDQHLAAAAAEADRRSWRSVVEEFETVRAASVTFFRDLPEPAWGRRGTASDNPFTVRALPWLAAGHVTHHTNVLRERYL